MKIVLDDILAKLDPKTRARVQSAVDVNVDKQPTPSIGLNLALKGGLAYGRQILVWGNKSAGTSSSQLATCDLILDKTSSDMICKSRELYPSIGSILLLSFKYVNKPFKWFGILKFCKLYISPLSTLIAG